MAGGAAGASNSTARASTNTAVSISAAVSTNTAVSISAAVSTSAPVSTSAAELLLIVQAPRSWKRNGLTPVGRTIALELAVIHHLSPTRWWLGTHRPVRCSLPGGGTHRPVRCSLPGGGTHRHVRCSLPGGGTHRHVRCSLPGGVRRNKAAAAAAVSIAHAQLCCGPALRPDRTHAQLCCGPALRPDRTFDLVWLAEHYDAVAVLVPPQVAPTVQEPWRVPLDA